MERIALLVLLCLSTVGCISSAPLGGSFDLRPPARPTATPTALPEPVVTPPGLLAVEPIVVGMPTPDPSSYRADVDVRELYRDLWSYVDVPLRFRGTVWAVIEQGELTFVQLKVPYGSGAEDWRAIVVLFPSYRVPIDSTRVREGRVVEVWARPRTMFQFTDDRGQNVEQPLLLGDRLEVLE